MAKTLDRPSLYDTDDVAIETGLSEAALPPRLPYSAEQLFERKLPAEELPNRRSIRKKSP